VLCSPPSHQFHLPLLNYPTPVNYPPTPIDSIFYKVSLNSIKMSLHDLPTELDDHIIGYLDMADTNSISRVNKYYRKLSEPHLYEHLNVRKNDPHRLRLLLRTLRCRKIKGLVLNLSHNESVTLQLLMPPDDCQITGAVLDPQGDAIYQDLQSLLIHINDAINGIVGSELPAQFKMAWFGKIFEPYPLFDGALSLSLCMATNLQSLDLQVSASSLFYESHVALLRSPTTHLIPRSLTTHLPPRSPRRICYCVLYDASVTAFSTTHPLPRPPTTHHSV
jgi:hypothetical protein